MPKYKSPRRTLSMAIAIPNADGYGKTDPDSARDEQPFA
jgi:hypothetical protein